MSKEQKVLGVWSVIGHVAVVNHLQQTVENHNPISALVLYGRAHSGKRAVAYRYAGSLICAKADDRPCGTCSPCRQLLAGTHSDVSVVSPDAETGSISIEVIRGLQERLHMRSFSNGHKVAIITNAQSMTPAAANALLKTLEEPSGETTIILTVSHPSQLLPTLLSRCQQFELLPVSTSVIAAALVERGVERKKAAMYAQLANGKPGLAVQYAFDNARYAEDQERYMSALAIVGARTVTEKFSLIRQKLGAQARHNGSELLEDVMSVVRDVVLIRFSLPALVHNPAATTALAEIASQHTPDQLSALFSGCHTALVDIRSNVNPALVLEDLFLNA